MKENNKQQAQQNNTDLQPMEELTDEALNEVAGGSGGGFGNQFEIGASVWGGGSIFASANINPNIIIINCW